MKLLITGGAGFIGSNFVRYALAKGDQVVVYDALTYAANPTTDELFSRNLLSVKDHALFSFIKGDVCDTQSMQQALQGIDAVVHFAAESHVDRSIENPQVFTETNVRGTETLLSSVKQVCPAARVLHVSTDEVYGSILQGFAKETDTFNPTSPYAQSKAEADRIALEWSKSLNVVVTRSSNNFGPYQFPEKFIPLSIVNLLLGEKIRVYGTGQNKRDWISVEDNCDALYFVLHHGKTGEAYNVGGGNEYTNIAIAQEIARLLEKDQSSIEFVTDRPNHDFRYALSSDKLHSLGWQPQQPFSQALQQTVQWYKNNRDWWEPLRTKRYTSINVPKS